ncbi:MAG TPA: Hsp20/alpha crystallin family protein [Candidatus Paceibacterota bacterium]|nr:Hsp20/alpha crystallin family protein [Candidatus Paceibacterota bacterium]
MPQEDKNKNPKADDPEMESTSADRRMIPERSGGSSFRGALDRFFDDGFEPLEFWRNPRGLAAQVSRSMMPRVDVSETDMEVKVVADVPGVDPDDIEIEVHENRMTISGSTEKEMHSDEKPYRYERSYGSFRREFTLPAKVEEEGIRATCKDGVLTIMLPKAEEEKKKKIRIERG